MALARHEGVLSFFLCEGIREEVGNKFTFLGVWKNVFDWPHGLPENFPFHAIFQIVPSRIKAKGLSASILDPNGRIIESMNMVELPAVDQANFLQWWGKLRLVEYGAYEFRLMDDTGTVLFQEYLTIQASS